MRFGPIRRHRVPLTICVVVLLVLHVVPPRSGLEPMLLGFLPWDLAYHLLWRGFAAAIAAAVIGSKLTTGPATGVRRLRL